MSNQRDNWRPDPPSPTLNQYNNYNYTTVVVTSRSDDARRRTTTINVRLLYARLSRPSGERFVIRIRGYVVTSPPYHNDDDDDDDAGSI